MNTQRKLLINRKKNLTPKAKFKTPNYKMMKKTPPAPDFIPGAYSLYIAENISCKVLNCDEEGIFLDIQINGSNYVTKNWAKENLQLISEHHFEVLKRYSSRDKLVKLLLNGRPEFSYGVIKSNNFSLKDFDEIGQIIVPELMTEIQFIQWKARLEAFVKRLHDETDWKKFLPTNDFAVKPQDFLVRVQKFRCLKAGHKLLDITAEILLMEKEGHNICSIFIPAGYCEQCEHYYILSSIYEKYSFEMRDALCDIIDESELHKYILTRTKQDNTFSTESILHKSGYNVSSATNMSTSERINLLNQIIEFKILNRSEIMNFLNWLIAFHANNPNMVNSITKWKEDLFGIINPSRENIVKIKRIIKK